MWAKPIPACVYAEASIRNLSSTTARGHLWNYQSVGFLRFTLTLFMHSAGSLIPVGSTHMSSRSLHYFGFKNLDHRYLNLDAFDRALSCKNADCWSKSAKKREQKQSYASAGPTWFHFSLTCFLGQHQV
ncbi:hypothetical protein TWF103_002476 [Orbilia oligospora]|nr:hypothetical protein TWF103_002476 [Orbilia oligospora]